MPEKSTKINITNDYWYELLCIVFTLIMFFQYIFSMEENKSTKSNFEYFIKMALQKKISWETLMVFLDDLTPTLVQSKQAIEVLVKELQILHSKLQEQTNIEETTDLIEVISTKNSSATIQNTQVTADILFKIRNKSTNDQSLEEDIDCSNENSEQQQIEATSKNIGASLDAKDTSKIDNTEKEFLEPEIIQIDDDELPIQGFRSDNAKSFKTEDQLTNANDCTLSFQINGEDCSIEFEDSDLVDDVGNDSIDNEKEMSNDCRANTILRVDEIDGSSLGVESNRIERISN